MKNILLLSLISLLGVQVSAQEAAYSVGAIGFYNLENLFDTLDTENVRDTEFTPKGSKVYNSALYHDKLNNLSSVIAEVGTELTPDGLAILGVAEIENRSVLEDLVEQNRLKSRNYQIVHFDSPDKRGIDVGLLYQPKYFEVTSSRNIALMLEDDKGERIFTRDVLFVSGLFDGEKIHILVNHWPSRRGGEERSSPLREQGAALCKTVVDSLTLADPMAKIILMGDLNDNPTNRSVKQILNAKRDKSKVPEHGIYNPYINMYKKGYGSNAWRDTWSLFDQIMVSEDFINGDKKEGYQFYQAKVFNESYLVQKTGQYKGYPFRTFVGDSYQGGYSDHFPAYIYLVKEIK